MPSHTEMEAGLRTLQDRFLIRLYAGLIPDQEHLQKEKKGLELPLEGCLVAACCEILPAKAGMTSEQLLKLNLACCQMLETTLHNYLRSTPPAPTCSTSTCCSPSRKSPPGASKPCWNPC